MNLQLLREIFTDQSTIGSLSIDGKFYCYTLEDVDRKLEDGGAKIYGQTAIPRGRYDIIIDWSPKYDKDMPHVLNVPQFNGVRIHTGNSAKDSEGCILVGKTKSTNWVGQSTIAFNGLMDMFEKAYERKEPINIEVI